RQRLVRLLCPYDAMTLCRIDVIPSAAEREGSPSHVRRSFALAGGFLAVFAARNDNLRHTTYATRTGRGIPLRPTLASSCPHTPGIGVEQSGHRPSFNRYDVTRKPLRPMTTALQFVQCVDSRSPNAPG